MLHADGHAPEDCRALSEELRRIGDRWTILVIGLVVGLLAGGPRRFNDVRRTIPGITQRMLTLTLRGLERDGLVARAVFPTVPPAVEYALTDRGRSLLDPLTALADWGQRNRLDIERSRAAFDAGPAADHG